MTKGQAQQWACTASSICTEDARDLIPAALGVKGGGAMLGRYHYNKVKILSSTYTSRCGGCCRWWPHTSVRFRRFLGFLLHRRSADCSHVSWSSSRTGDCMHGEWKWIGKSKSSLWASRAWGRTWRFSLSMAMWELVSSPELWSLPSIHISPFTHRCRRPTGSTQHATLRLMRLNIGKTTHD